MTPSAVKKTPPAKRVLAGAGNVSVGAALPSALAPTRDVEVADPVAVTDGVLVNSEAFGLSPAPSASGVPPNGNDGETKAVG